MRENKNMKKYLVITSILLMSSPVYAGQHLNNKTIKDVLVNTTTGIHFRIEGQMPNADNCKSASWYAVDKDSPYENAALSILLTRDAQKQTVYFHTNGCTKNGYPKVSYIY
ncbi:hypothetical protein CWB73_00445 [Pseudoalteromonas phenolica]|uniref:Secreted protein n=2 Tax=Pseudoalteromonas phenolica TaxID=161398 RepID=A0A5S3YYS9_9GAMM|nr:hypothetical protein CWB73_00445 [Pseudoalteromonas phenolica]